MTTKIAGTQSAPVAIGQLNLVNASVGICILQLPPASDYASTTSRRPTVIAKIDSSSNPVLIFAHGDETISAQLPEVGLALSQPFQSYSLESDGRSGWIIVSAYGGTP